MLDIDLDNLNEDMVYEAFGVEGNEGEALNDIYLELFELIGRDGMLKLFKYFRGDKIDGGDSKYQLNLNNKFG